MLLHHSQNEYKLTTLSFTPNSRWELHLISEKSLRTFPRNHLGYVLRLFSKSEMDPIIAKASAEAIEQGIHGQKLTPFLLSRISELTEGKSLHTNLALLLNNARLAAQIAGEETKGNKVKTI